VPSAPLARSIRRTVSALTRDRPARPLFAPPPARSDVIPPA